MPEKNTQKNSVRLPVLQPQAGKSYKPKQKSGRGKIRALVLISVHVVILLHLTHYWIAGRSLSPVEPSEAMASIELGHLNAGAIFFGIAILSTAVFGRFFCGWGCHLVALQDLCGHLLRRSGIRPKPLRSRLLILVPFALAFYMFCWPTLKRLVKGDVHPGFSNYLMTENFWYTFPGPIVSILTFLVCGGLIVYLLGNKGFCTYACPYGAFFSIADRVAVGRIRVTDACQHCGQCTAHCTSNVRIHSEVKEFGMVVDPGCMKCMDCVSVCPNDALYFGLVERAGARATAKKEVSTDSIESEAKPAKRKKTYDFSLIEELAGLVITAIAVFALRGLYTITPLLLAVALGVLTAFFTLQIARLFRKRDLRIQNHRLKRDNKVTTKGKWAILLFIVWGAFISHSTFVQYNRYMGRYHLNKVPASWVPLLFGQVQDSYSANDLENVEAAISSYQRTDRFGLKGTLDVKMGLAIASMMKSDDAGAEKYLREAYQCDPDASRNYLTEFLVSRDKQEEAAEFF